MLIAPNLPAKKAEPKNNKNILDGFLVDIALRTTEDLDGTIRTNAERAALKLWENALCAEDAKVSLRALELLYNRIGGKPNIKVEEEKTETPEIVFQISSKDSKRLQNLIEREPVAYEEDDNDKVVVEIEGEAKMVF